MRDTELIEITRPDWDQITNIHLLRLANQGWRIVSAHKYDDEYTVVFEREVRDGQ